MNNMNNYLKYIATLLSLLILLSYSSCDNDDDNSTSVDLYEIVVDKPVVRIGANEEATVKIVFGNEGYSVKSFDSSIATASISGDVITIKSLNKQGATTVQVQDKEGVVGDITVAVGVFDLEVNHKDISMERGNSISLIVSSGNFSSNDELSISIADPSIISLDNTDPYRPYYTLKGVSIGSTTVTFTDRLGKEAIVNVEITPVSIETDLVGKEAVVGVNNKLVVKVLKGNLNYVATPEDDAKVAVSVKDSLVYIVGKAEGSTPVLLEDGEGQQYSFTVNVSKVKQVANMGSSNYFSVPFYLKGVADPSLKSVNNITYEARFRIDQHNGDDNGNARINTIMGIEQIFLMRVDVHKGDTGNRFLQLAADKKGSIRFEGSTKIETGIWYNVAVVLDGSKTGTDRLKLYVNGVEETLQLSAGTPADLKEIDLTSNFFIAQSDGKRRLNGAISYARIWTKALSGPDISKYNGIFVDPSTSGLTAYWAFSNPGADVQKFVSLTNNDFEAIAANKITTWTVDPILE